MNFCLWCCKAHPGPACWPVGDGFTQAMREPRVYPSGAACGDCEYMPCRCNQPDDLDLAWLPNLADHDNLTTRVVQEADAA